MTTTLHLMPVVDAPENLDELAELMTPALVDAREQFAEIQAIADTLDQVRRICGDLGGATLLAECHGAPRELICAALDEVVQAGVRALTALHQA